MFTAGSSSSQGAPAQLCAGQGRRAVTGTNLSLVGWAFSATPLNLNKLYPLEKHITGLVSGHDLQNSTQAIWMVR